MFLDSIKKHETCMVLRTLYFAINFATQINIKHRMKVWDIPCNWKMSTCMQLMNIFFKQISLEDLYIQGGPKSKPLSRIIIKSY